MAIGSTAALVAGGVAAAGAIGGAVAGATDKTTVNKVNVGAASGLENAASAGIGSDYNSLRGMVDAGPGSSDITAGTTASRDLAAMLDSYSKSGGLPGANDITSANNLAGGLFQGQRQALQQNFMDQQTAARQNAAISGRGLNDPVLQNKLAQEQTRQQMLLDANQGSLSQQLAMALPGQRLDYSAQKANVLQGLASQAMSNRQALLNIGEGIQTNERNFRLATADRSSTQQGSVGGAISGGFAGLGSGLSAASSLLGGPLGGMLGGGGGGGGGGMGGGGGGGSPFSLGVNTNLMGSMNPFTPAASAMPMGGGGTSTFNLGSTGGGGQSSMAFFGRTTVGGRK